MLEMIKGMAEEWKRRLGSEAGQESEPIVSNIRRAWRWLVSTSLSPSKLAQAQQDMLHHYSTLAMIDETMPKLKLAQSLTQIVSILSRNHQQKGTNT